MEAGNFSIYDDVTGIVDADAFNGDPPSSYQFESEYFPITTLVDFGTEYGEGDVDYANGRDTYYIGLGLHVKIYHDRQYDQPYYVNYSMQWSDSADGPWTPKKYFAFTRGQLYAGMITDETPAIKVYFDNVNVWNGKFVRFIAEVKVLDQEILDTVSVYTLISFGLGLDSGLVPTDTPTPTPTPTRTNTPTNTPTVPTPTEPAVPITELPDTPTASPTWTPSFTPTNTPVPTDTPSKTFTPTDTSTRTPIPTFTPTPLPTDLPEACPTFIWQCYGPSQEEGGDHYIPEVLIETQGYHYYMTLNGEVWACEAYIDDMTIAGKLIAYDDAYFAKDVNICGNLNVGGIPVEVTRIYERLRNEIPSFGRLFVDAKEIRAVTPFDYFELTSSDNSVKFDVVGSKLLDLRVNWDAQPVGTPGATPSPDTDIAILRDRFQHEIRAGEDDTVTFEGGGDAEVTVDENGNVVKVYVPSIPGFFHNIGVGPENNPVQWIRGNLRGGPLRIITGSGIISGATPNLFLPQISFDTNWANAPAGIGTLRIKDVTGDSYVLSATTPNQEKVLQIHGDANVTQVDPDTVRINVIGEGDRITFHGVGDITITESGSGLTREVTLAVSSSGTPPPAAPTLNPDDPIWNANELFNIPLTTATPLSNGVLRYNGVRLEYFTFSTPTPQSTPTVVPYTYYAPTPASTPTPMRTPTPARTATPKPDPTAVPTATAQPTFNDANSFYKDGSRLATGNWNLNEYNISNIGTLDAEYLTINRNNNSFAAQIINVGTTGDGVYIQVPAETGAMPIYVVRGTAVLFHIDATGRIVFRNTSNNNMVIMSGNEMDFQGTTIPKSIPKLNLSVHDDSSFLTNDGDLGLVSPD